jgi:hypothetical protein
LRKCKPKHRFNHFPTPLLFSLYCGLSHKTCILRHQAWLRWNLQHRILEFVKISLNTLCIATSKSI